MHRFTHITLHLLSIRHFLIAGMCLCLAQKTRGQTVTYLNDLSAFKSPGKTWQVVGGVRADLSSPNTLDVSRGSGILVNLPDRKTHGVDLFTKDEYGDIDLELDYMMAKGSNSGIYLQGRYEVQLHDSWTVITPTSANNGGIYEQWDESRPDGAKGYGGYAPRSNASRAPGLWQHLKISFQAPRFDNAGKKIEWARMVRVELNGVLIHENVGLPGPTRGGLIPEKPTGPLRIQGDHGAVAFRNIKITVFDSPRAPEGEKPNRVYPILVEASTRPVFRSFMDLPGGRRVVHAVSAGSDENVHYTYDTDTGMLLQVWRGGFLDATPMWYSRGDGSARPVGAITRFGNPVPALERLASPQAPWMTDTTGMMFHPKGYTLNPDETPEFQYRAYGAMVNDATKVLAGGQGISREILIRNPQHGLYFRLAAATNIVDLGKGMYVLDDQSYYLRLDDADGNKPIIRNAGDKKELIVPVGNKLSYSILF